MVGRALRGPQAKGTELAYVVDFHDTWDKINFWMDPSKIDIFAPEITIQEEPTEPEYDFNPPDSDTEDDVDASHEPSFLVNSDITEPTDWDLYIHIYQNMKSNLVSGLPIEVFPNGWYSVADMNGNDTKILVYDSQVQGYQQVEAAKDSIINKYLSIDNVIASFFETEACLPKYSDIKLFCEYIVETGDTPEYYDFTARDRVDTKKIANEMNRLFEKDDEKEMWLQEMFDSSSIIRELFRYFYVFKRAVNNPPIDTGIIETIDAREVLSFSPEVFDLDELLDELIDEYPFFNRQKLVSISWSKSFVKRWFGLCHRWLDDSGETHYSIQINKILSADDVQRETVKYLIYHEMLHKSGYWSHDDSFRYWEWSFPNSDEHDGFLDSFALRYKMELVWTKRNEVANEAEVIDNRQAVEADTPNTAKTQDFKFCRSCGNRLPADSNFCDKCGSKTDYDY